MPSAASSLSASKCESPELASAKRGAAREAVAVRLELVDEAPKRRPVAQAAAVVAKRAAVAALLPGARRGRRIAPAGLGARRRDRDPAEGAARLRRFADAVAPGREPGPQAVGGDPVGVRRVRPAGLERRARVEGGPAEAAPGDRAQGEAIPPLAGLTRAEAGREVARAARPGRARRGRGETVGRPLPARLARRRGQGEAVQDGGLRDRRIPLERQGRRTNLHALARALRRRG